MSPSPDPELRMAPEVELELLRALVAELQTENAALRVQIAELLARLNRNSSNSSLPPSADPPSTPKTPAGPGSGRKRGGQPGHVGVTRLLLPAADVTHFVPVFPVQCAHCDALFPGAPATERPVRHQVVELPPVVLEVTEYQLHALTCPQCRQVTRAALPPEAPTRHAGFRLQAFAALLTGRHHVSRRQTQELLADLLGQTFALGTLSALERDVTAALAAAYAEIAAVVAAAPRVNVDETGWREGKQRPYLWAVVSETATLFRIGSRTKATLAELLPDRAEQIVTSDRYAAYLHLAPEQRQLCWAHLVRDFVGLTERATAVARAVGHWALAVARDLFALWDRHRAGRLDRATLQEEAAPLRDTLRTALRLGAAGDCAPTAGFCTSLLACEASLWTFLREPGVEPTNNAAERAVRPGVLWRKKSSGHQSETGRQFVERLLSVSATLRQQGRNLLTFLEASLRAVAAGTAPPRVFAAESG